MSLEATPVLEDAADLAPQPRLAVHSFGLTDRGLVRTSNEDQFLVASLFKALQVRQTSLPGDKSRHSTDRSHLFIVADGMGGEAAGETASAMALDCVETYVLEMLHWFACCRARDEEKVLTEFKTAMTLAHSQLRKEADEHPQLRGMGTTMTLAYSLNEVLFLAHVGDSRCYLFRGQHLHRLTQDHTLVEALVQSGSLSPEEAATHRLRHVIVSTVGGTDPDIRVDVHRLHLEERDQVLLCSDGLSNMISDQELSQILTAGSTPEITCRQLVDLANANGGKDNVTVIVARYDAEA